MHALVVVSHPDPQSLTHAVAQQVVEGVISRGEPYSAEIADLAAEAFDPRFTNADLAVHLKNAQPPADVVSEQQRIDRARALVIVYPVYWWSMPGLLKGWIDRVFTRGWAYDDSPEGTVKKLHRLPVHLVALGGAGQSTYARRGYFGAMRLQIDHGIFGYCGAQVATSELLLQTDADFPSSALDAARDIGRNVFLHGR